MRRGTRERASGPGPNAPETDTRFTRAAARAGQDVEDGTGTEDTSTGRVPKRRRRTPGASGGGRADDVAESGRDRPTYPPRAGKGHRRGLLSSSSVDHLLLDDKGVNHQPASLDDLPSEVLVKVFERVDRAETYSALARVSRRMADVARVPQETVGRLMVEQKRQGKGAEWNDGWMVRMAIAADRVPAVLWLLRDESMRQEGLIDAARFDKPHLVQVILAMRGVDVNANVGGWTALGAAAKNGLLDLMRVLLDAGARVNEQDERGRIALHWASSQGQLEAFRVLLEHGADPSIVDEDGHNVEVFVRGSFVSEEQKQAMLALLAEREAH